VLFEVRWDGQRNLLFGILGQTVSPEAEQNAVAEVRTRDGVVS
jgi:hypothetical protein